MSIVLYKIQKLKIMTQIKFLLVRPVKSPIRANEFDAGIDFFVPEFNKDFIEDMLCKKPNRDAFNISLPSSELKEIAKEEDEKPWLSYTSNYNNGILRNIATDGICISDGNLGTIRNNAKDFFGFDIKEGKSYFVLKPQKRVMIPSGVKSRMSKPGRALIAANKSGIAVNHGLVFGAQVVDYTYKGEIHISVINTSNEEIKIYAGMKLIQFLEQPVYNSAVTINNVSTSEEFFEGLQDDRGESGFGSTNKK